MEKSESIKAIGKALALFHTKVAKIPKTDTNPFFKSVYAGLPSILQAIQIPLEESGLVFSQHPDSDSLTTILIHFESGEFLQSSFLMKPVKNDPQSIGSAITYARRYALGAILGLNIDVDDDGNHASQPKSQPAATPPAQRKAFLSQKQFDELRARLLNGEAGVIEKAREVFELSQETIDKLLK
jgi:hypothetical protein